MHDWICDDGKEMYMYMNWGGGGHMEWGQFYYNGAGGHKQYKNTHFFTQFNPPAIRSATQISNQNVWAIFKILLYINLFNFPLYHSPIIAWAKRKFHKLSKIANTLLKSNKIPLPSLGTFGHVYNTHTH